MSDRRFFTPDRLALLGILLLSAAVYFPALGGMPILDDHMIASGAAIGGGDSFIDCLTKPFLFHYFRPMVSVSFWLEMKLHGATPFLLHQTNILIHVLTTYLVIKLAEACGLNRTAALLGGLFFAIQPAQVGAVAWIGGRTDSQSCLFLVGMLLAIARYSTDRKWWWIPIGVVSGFLGMLTKEQVLPAIVLAPLAPFAFGMPRKKGLLSSVPYLFTGLLFFALWIWGSPEHVKGATVPLGEIASQVSRTAVNFGLLFVAPNPWSLHAYTLENFRGSLWLGLGYFICLAIPFGIWRLWKYDPRVAWLAIGGALVYVPVSNLIPIPSLLAAPYRVALSGPTVAILLGLAASKFREIRPLGLAAGLIAVASLIITPWGASKHANETTLFHACVQFDPMCYYMRSNYQTTLMRDGKLDASLRQNEILFDQIFVGHDWHDYGKLKYYFDDDPTIGERILETHGSRAEAAPLISRYLVGLGQLFLKLNRDAESEKVLRAAIQLDSWNDSAYFGLGQIVLKTNPVDGIYCLKNAIALNSDNGGAIYALGRYYVDQKDYVKAHQVLQRVLKVPYDTGEPLLDLADVDLRLGYVAEARLAIAKASRSIVDKSRQAELLKRANGG